jgi:hypothetical protein
MVGLTVVGPAVAARNTPSSGCNRLQQAAKGFGVQLRFCCPRLSQKVQFLKCPGCNRLQQAATGCKGIRGAVLLSSSVTKSAAPDAGRSFWWGRNGSSYSRFFLFERSRETVICINLTDKYHTVNVFMESTSVPNLANAPDTWHMRTQGCILLL